MASRWGTTALVQPDPITGSPTPLTAAALVGRAARALALIVGGAVGGLALAMLFRSSLAAIGLVAGYGLAGEAVLRSVSPDIEPFLLSGRVAAFLDGEYRITRYPTACGSQSCEPEIIRLTALQGGIYLGVLLAVVLLASVVLFRRRDVG